MTLPPNLQAVRDRADKATAGPWKASNGDKVFYVSSKSHSGHIAKVYPKNADANANFMTASRTDVPALLDLIETLAGALDGVLAIGYEHANELEFVRAALDKYREFK